MPEDNLPADGVTNIDETAAAATLRPGGGSWEGVTKAEQLALFSTLLSQLGKEDLSHLFNQVQSQYGPNKAPGEKDNSGANKASLSPNSRPIREDVEEMFEGQELSEEFKERASVIFEAVVSQYRTHVETKLVEEFETREAELKEELDAKLQEEVNGIFDQLAEQLNSYLDYATGVWMEENKVAVDNGLRGQIAESFITGLHTLFSEHYITVPEGQIDIMAEMKEKIENLEGKLDEALNANLELSAVVEESNRLASIEEAVEGLTLVDAEKFRGLAEGLEYLDAAGFAKKLTIIKENYFGKKPTDTGILTETVEEPAAQAKAPVLSESVAAYAKALKAPK